MKRREFLKITAATSTVMPVLPGITAASELSGRPAKMAVFEPSTLREMSKMSIDALSETEFIRTLHDKIYAIFVEQMDLLFDIVEPVDIYRTALQLILDRQMYPDPNVIKVYISEAWFIYSALAKYAYEQYVASGYKNRRELEIYAIAANLSWTKTNILKAAKSATFDPDRYRCS
jgi:hypothetical protein